MLSSRKSSNPAPAVPYTLSKSLRFRSSVPTYLSRTFGSPTSTTILTISFWVKRGTLGPQNITFNGGDTTGNNTFYLQFNPNNQINYDQSIGGAQSIRLISTAVFTDPSAWYHIVASVDTTQSTASNRVKLYVNGNQITSFGTATYPAQNTVNQFNVNGRVCNIGKLDYYPLYLDAYIADAYFIDGQALTPSSFGSTNATTGQWSPAKYTGSYGNNGFHLTFANTASTTTLGYDTSGNGNNWSTSGFSLTAGTTYDSMNDVPVAYSATAANWCVLNPNDKSNSSLVISDGNLSYSGTSGWWCVRSSFGMTTGKWYCEIKITGGGSPYNTIIGLMTSQSNLFSPSDSYPGLDAYGWGYYGSSGNIYNNGSHTAYGSAFGNGDTIGIAFDAGAGSLTFYYDGTSQGVAFTGLTSGPYYFAFSQVGANGSVNFGQQPFTYTPPSGYNALNTYNLPTPTIAQGNKYMDATTYTGNGNARSITNTAGFQPDLVWAKGRSVTYDNEWYDSNRGATKRIISNSTAAEATVSGVTAFNSNGFSLGTDGGTNQASATYVAWQWQAGAGTTSSNTNGSITSTVSVSTTAGFSIVTWTYNGSGTIGHGLGAVPQMIIQKDRTSGTYNWDVYHVSLGNTKRAILNSSAVPDVENVWNNTTPTSSVYSIGSSWFTNGDNIVAYCFAQITGFSAFGTYSGNSSNQFIYTGFQPKWVMVKLSGPSGGGSWTVFDTSRSPYNLEALRLQPNSSNAEASTGSNGINGLSNGFQLVGDYNGGDTNLSGYTYIYAAFASNPFAYSNAF
jgi:hypothetical protein